MEGFQLDDYFTSNRPQTKTTRSKPVKRKWREIEAIKDRQRLQKELMDLDMGGDYPLEDITL